MDRIVVEGKEGLLKLVGKELPPSPWYTLSFEDIQKFADATDDHQWIHVDRERAKRESPYGGPIAHGYFSLARIGGIFVTLMDLRGFGMTVNYGLNKVRFPAPLREGARYRLKMELASTSEIPNGVEAIFRCTVEIENEPKPACAAECVFRLLG